MCCIFTCCGWMIDLIQRVWTFTMSCCISSAICCVMVSSSLSGIALGYNYSLAEYIDLKETNVSVYLKRGVFDDEIADDMDWRRAGRLPVAGHINEDNLITEGPEVDQPLRSGRRLDDSVFDSGGDHHKFEGSLMKLTAKPLDAPITPVTYTPDEAMQEAHSNNPISSMERLKAIQEVLNKKRHEFTSSELPAGGRRRMNDIASQDTPQNPSYPPTLNIWPDIMSGRRFDPHDPRLIGSHQDVVLNPARTAVPPKNIGRDDFWKIPYLATSTRPTYGFYNEMVPQTLPTRPGPVKFDWGPIRPTTKRTTNTPEPVRVVTIQRIPEVEAAKSAEEFDKLGQKLGGNDLERSRLKLFQDRFGGGDDDYDVDPKGIPSRKKRRTVSMKFPDVFSTENGRKIQDNDKDGKGFPNRYKRNIVSSSISIPSFIEKLSKASDVFRTETVPNKFVNDMNIIKISSRKKKHIISRGRSSTTSIPSTLGALSKSSDVFRTKKVPKTFEGDVNAKEILSRKERQIVDSSSTMLFTLSKLSKSSDVFHTETVPKTFENDMDVKGIPSRKKRHIVDTFSNIYTGFGKLGKSSAVLRTETVPKIHENIMDSKIIKNRLK